MGNGSQRQGVWFDDAHSADRRQSLLDGYLPHRVSRFERSQNDQKDQV